MATSVNTNTILCDPQHLGMCHCRPERERERGNRMSCEDRFEFRMYALTSAG